MTVESNLGDKKYTVGGELSVDSPYYIRRKADRDLIKSLKEGKFCYVLNPRQTGKSSLMIQIKHDLEAEITKYYCSIIYIPDLIVEPGTTEENRYTSEEKFYNSLIYNLAQDFIKPIHKNTVIEFPEWLEQWINDNNHLSPVERLSEFVEKQLLVKNQDEIVVFFDEIDSILRSSFNKNNFWNFIESCYNKRQNIPKYQRLTFAIFGVATLDELIQDRDNKLFEIGQAIELDSFDSSITNQFQEGLKNKFNNNMFLVRAAINAILSWTNGQPFLTNQICQLLQDINEPFPNSKSEIEKFIKKLVESKIIDMDNWQVLEDKKDETNNLKAIYNQCLTRGRRNPRLFECYQEILKAKQNGIDTNDSAEQRELLISGLVLKTEGGKLKVYNKIYELVFSREWLEKAIASIPPYSEFFYQWLKLNQDSSYLLHGQELKQALIWVLDNKLSEEQDRFLKTSIASDKERELEELQKAEEEKKSQKKREEYLRERLLAKDKEIAKLQKEIMKKKIYFLVKWISPVLIVSALLSILIDGLFKLHLYEEQFPKIIAKIQGLTQKKNSDQEGFSSGEKRLFPNSESSVNKGMKEYRSNNYEKAINYFNQALVIIPNDPEIKIYLNNAKAHRKGSGSVSKIAVVFPVIDSKEDQESQDAKEVLRGIADAQDEFNSSITEDNLPLEITIINYKNAAISEMLDNGIKGLIIPDLVRENKKEYEQLIEKYNQEGLPVICITSTQTDLCGENLPKAQIVFPNSRLSKQLTQYATKTLTTPKKKKKVIIFYDSQTNTKLKEAFEKEFNNLEWEIYDKVDLKDPKIKPDSQIKRSLENQVSIAVLLPSPQSYEVALSIAQANAENIQTSASRGLKLFSNDLMYNSQTLIKGGLALKGLTLILRWSDETPSGSYIEQSNKKWYGQISWRTIASYAATKALIQAISSSANAEGKTAIQILETIKPQGEPPLITVSPDALTTKDAELGFKSLPNE